MPHVRALERHAGEDPAARREVEELHRLLGTAAGPPAASGTGRP